MRRRDLLIAAAAGALAARRREAFGAKVLRAGLVGCGWYGMVDLRHLMALGQVKVVGLCDPDRKHLDAAATEVAQLQGERPDSYADFREMLKPDRYDVVIVGSPDHWHALHAIAAMKAGADVYCQKPISHTVLEGEAMVKAARRLGRVVQVGTQRRSTEHIAKARELVREGKLGRVAMARAHCHMRARREIGPDEAAPPHLDFDLWTGPAPLRPFNAAVHPKGWRRFDEYSNGVLGDMGIHMLDLVRWFCDVRWPRRISSVGGIYFGKGGRSNVPDTQTVTFDYDDLTVVWEHRAWGAQEWPDDFWGVSFYGEKGILRVNLERFELVPADKAEKPLRVECAREPDPTKLEGDHVRPAGRAHMKDFLDAIARRTRPVADIEEGHVSSALCELGTIAQKTGRPIVWDARRERRSGTPRPRACSRAPIGSRGSTRAVDRRSRSDDGPAEGEGGGDQGGRGQDQHRRASTDAGQGGGAAGGRRGSAARRFGGHLHLDRGRAAIGQRVLAALQRAGDRLLHGERSHQVRPRAGGAAVAVELGCGGQVLDRQIGRRDLRRRCLVE